MSARNRKNVSQHHIKLSKKLSYILRHAAIKFGITIRPDGLVNVKDLLDHQYIGSDYSFTDIESVVKTNDKQRFELKTIDGIIYIRATQGHSIPCLDLDLTPITLADLDKYPCIVHGTYFSAWEKIKVSGGLSSMSRNHIHLAKGLPKDGSVISGMRSSSEVCIYINLAKALADGIPFFVSKNGVVLTEGNPLLGTKYFISVTDAKGKELKF